MIRFIDKPIFGLVHSLAASCLGCSEDEPTASEPTQASTVVNPTEGNEAQGTVEFTQETGGVRVVANLTGLTEGDHGFHIHEKGDCSAADGTSAGGHFNPEGTAHGAPDAAERHVGDLGNITADASGQATYQPRHPPRRMVTTPSSGLQSSFTHSRTISHNPPAPGPVSAVGS